jgi:hypothetical protein
MTRRGSAAVRRKAPRHLAVATVTLGLLGQVDPARAGTLDLSGSLRARYEALDGQFRPGFDARDDLFSLRTTLLARYAAKAVSVTAEIYDSRAYGGEPGSAIGTGEVNTLELVQAYAAVDIPEPFGDGSRAALQAGRFTLNLGSRRLVAADDYRNTTNGYTGLRADLSLRDGTAATLIYVLPQLRLPDDQPSILDNRVGLDRERFDLRLWGGLVARRRALGPATLEASYYGFAERDDPARPTRNRHLHTYGGRVIREPGAGAFDYEIEALRQTGRIRASLAAAAPALDVAAWFAHAEVGYSFAGGWKPRLAVEIDHASGDRAGGRYGRFDTLFGMRRADLGPAGIYAAIGRTNLTAVGPRVEASPSKRIDGFITYRALWAASATDGFATTGVRDPTGAAGRFAGHQVDARLRWWWIRDRLRAEANAAWLAKRGLLEEAPNAPTTGDTRYLSLALLANF